jgi:hypothetical protein
MTSITMLNGSSLRANALAARLRAPDGGYARRRLCVGQHGRARLQSGQVHIYVDRTLDGAALAWAQHLETGLAYRLALPFSEGD